MAWHPMKPETIARRAREAAEAAIRRDNDLFERLSAKAKEKPESIFPELLEEFLENNPKYRLQSGS